MILLVTEGTLVERGRREAYRNLLINPLPNSLSFDFLFVLLMYLTLLVLFFERYDHSVLVNPTVSPAFGDTDHRGHGLKTSPGDPNKTGE